MSRLQASSLRSILVEYLYYKTRQMVSINIDELGYEVGGFAAFLSHLKECHVEFIDTCAVQWLARLWRLSSGYKCFV